jgi:hypothetical protein
VTRQLFIWTIFLGLTASCGQQAKQTNANTADSSFVSTVAPAETAIIDESKYSKSFLDKLNNNGLHCKLNDSLLIDGPDTAHFPTDLPLNKQVIFAGSKNNINYTLTVERKNYTTLSYKFERSNWTAEQGQADIGSGFFLGAETDDDDKTGMSYLSTEYSFQNADCYFGIRIGWNEDEKNNELCAKVVRHCRQDKSKDISDCPSLYIK